MALDIYYPFLYRSHKLLNKKSVPWNSERWFLQRSTSKKKLGFLWCHSAGNACFFPLVLPLSERTFHFSVHHSCGEPACICTYWHRERDRWGQTIHFGSAKWFHSYLAINGDLHLQDYREDRESLAWWNTCL